MFLQSVTFNFSHWRQKALDIRIQVFMVAYVIFQAVIVSGIEMNVAVHAGIC